MNPSENSIGDTMETDLDQLKTMLTKAGVQFRVYRGFLTTAEPLRLHFNPKGELVVGREPALAHTCTERPRQVCAACKQTDDE
jgi:hypothetical protein